MVERVCRYYDVAGGTGVPADTVARGRGQQDRVRRGGAPGRNTFEVSRGSRASSGACARILVGQIVEVQPHPNADRLVLADVDYGAKEPERACVTGAPSICSSLMAAGPMADGPQCIRRFAEGAESADGHAEGRKRMTLKATKLRGIPSETRWSAPKELGCRSTHEGIIIHDADAPVGTPIADYMGDVVLASDHQHRALPVDHRGGARGRGAEQVGDEVKRDGLSGERDDADEQIAGVRDAR